MNLYEKETTPVVYNSAGIKIIHFFFDKSEPFCFRMHWHERMEFLIVRDGKIRIDFGTHSQVFSEGDIVIIHPNQLHKGTLASNFVDYDTFMFDVRLFYNNTEVCKKNIPAVFDGQIRFSSSTNNPEILTCLNTIIKFAKDDKRALYITSKIYELLWLLCENCVLESSVNRFFDKNIQEITSYIQKNIETDLSTEALSQQFKYSKTYFCKKFKNSTGLSPMNYIKILRIEKAYRLFKEGETNISTTAIKCGFTDPNYFTRCFKKHFGFPPSHFISKK